MISEFREKMNYGKIFFILALSLFFSIGLFGQKPNWAQEKDYPNRPIRIVIPYAAGGVSDPPIRMTADYLNRELKVPIIVENKEGASGMIGANEVLKAKDDGYTLMGVTDSGLVLGPLASKDPPYDPLKAFVCICAYGWSPGGFAVHKSSPFKDLRDYIEAAKRNPGKITTAVPSLGNDNHLTFEEFRRNAAVDLKLVPYKGNGELYAALLGKHVDSTFNSYVSFAPYLKSGEVRVLGTTAKVPGSSLLSFDEAGYPRTAKPRYNGFFVSSKIPKPVLEKLVSVFKRTVTNPELVKKWETVYLYADYKSPDEFSEFIKSKVEVYKILLDELGMKKR